ncbi:MAG: hypothetical protein OXG25_12535 [Gammaproteobacteria bacterium]|nr:hypothetical protein [Gammaproteobacteria bacterium]
MTKKTRTPRPRSIPWVFLTIAVSAGCSTFDHPLPWPHSPLHEELPGSWHAVHESEPPMPIEVTKNGSGSLSVDMTVSDTDESAESDSTQSSGNQVHRVTFQGDVLLSNGVHVLQIDMKTYRKHKREGKATSSDKEGYWFVRVVSEDGSLVFQQLEIEPFARYAESQLFDEKTALTASEYASCINTRISSEIASRILDDLLRERPTNWLSKDELSELEKVLKEFENRTVDPYQQLKRMRECIAYKLQGELLGRLFSADPDGIFSDEPLRLVRVR